MNVHGNAIYDCKKNSAVTGTIAGPQFQCMCSGLGIVGPVSSGVSSGPILMILLL